MTQKTSSLRSLAAGSALLFLFAPTLHAAEQTGARSAACRCARLDPDGTTPAGKCSAEGNADEKLDPASLTKIMTSYVVGQALKAGKIKLDDMVTVGKGCLGDRQPRAARLIGDVPEARGSGVRFRSE